MATIDKGALARFRQYEDAASGISESFVDASVGPHDALAILSRPLVGALPFGWVICPSFGTEQANLRRLEALVARALAAVGFPTLRIRDRPLVRHDITDESLSHLLEQADDALRVLRQDAAIERIGLAGALFGGTVATLAAEHLRLDALAVWEPATNGSRYLRKALRLRTISQLVSTDEGMRVERGRSMRDELEESGETIVRGRRLTSEAYEQMAAIELEQDIQHFRGRALILGVSTNGELSAPLRGLSRRLEERGATVTAEGIRDPLKAPFGEHYYWNLGAVRIDTRLALDQAIAKRTATWASAEASETLHGDSNR